MTSLNAGDSAMTIDKFDAGEIIDETVKRYDRTLKEKGLQIHVEKSAERVDIVSDRSKVERIFQNAFNNAVKFTSQGKIDVRARRAGDGSGVEIEISDTGIGIEKNKLNSIFEPFQQVDGSLQRSFAGLGLGLTVARRMADLIGGKLEITSSPNVGTRVLMKFPSQGSAATSIALEQRKYG
jgi:signal transduction histidine kinase